MLIEIDARGLACPKPVVNTKRIRQVRKGYSNSYR